MRWMVYTIPLQGLLLLSQLTTGLLNEHFSGRVYTIVHVGGGSLLVGLVIIHVFVNFDWIRRTYASRHRPVPGNHPGDESR